MKTPFIQAEDKNERQTRPANICPNSVGSFEKANMSVLRSL
jgi:hypothetical protein